MTCRNCGKETQGVRYTGFCRHCGALLGLSPPSEEERQDATPALAQKQVALPEPAVTSPGPLLTGRIAFDAALGFMGEIVAFALFVYSVWQFLYLARQGGGAELLFPFGMFCTALFLLWHTKVMRARYPTFAKGWQTGRNTWGVGVDHFLTLLFGILMLCVLFPLGGLLYCLGLAFGPIGWIGALLVAYVFGLLARRMSSGSKKPGGTAP
jgi:hypothetical protein